METDEKHIGTGFGDIGQVGFEQGKIDLFVRQTKDGFLNQQGEFVQIEVEFAVQSSCGQIGLKELLLIEEALLFINGPFVQMVEENSENAEGNDERDECPCDGFSTGTREETGGKSWHNLKIRFTICSTTGSYLVREGLCFVISRMPGNPSR